MKKIPFLTLEKAKEIREQIPTPFYVYDEAGIRANARLLKAAFSWNPGFREYFAVKATPNPFLLKRAAAATAPPIRSCCCPRPWASRDMT